MIQSCRVRMFVLYIGILGCAWEPQAEIQRECGVQCVYAVHEYFGQSVDYENLLLTRVTSAKGSSIHDLVSALQASGLHAYAVKNLAKHDLLHSRYPIILHVRGQVGNPEFDHYEVLFPGTGQRGPVLFSPPDRAGVLSFVELAPRWRGWGIIVSPEEIDPRTVSGSTRWRLTLGIVLVGLLALVLNLARTKLSQKGGEYWRLSSGIIARFYDLGIGATILCAGSVFVALFVSMSSDSYLTSTVAIKAIRSNNFATYAEKVGVEDVKSAISSGAVLVDARYERDFDLGHIDGALNVPPSATRDDIKDRFRGISTEQHIVIYCQSRLCPYAGNVGKQLHNLGYEKIVLYEEGWVNWKL